MVCIHMRKPMASLASYASILQCQAPYLGTEIRLGKQCKHPKASFLATASGAASPAPRSLESARVRTSSGGS